MSIGQPCVEWKHRNLDGETDKHSCEDPYLHIARNRATILNQEWDRKTLCASFEEQCKKCNEHQSRTKHGVEEKLERCILTVFATPHTDHEVHRQEHELEEYKEQDEVLGNKCACHTCLQHEHQDEERFWVTWVWNMVEAVDHDEQCDHHRQDVERQADSIEADEVTALDERNPLVLGNELH